MPSKHEYPKLESLLRVSSSNYFFLLRMANPHEGRIVTLRLRSDDNHNDTLWSIEPKDSTRYSHGLSIQQHNHPTRIKMKVRMYHDSCQAEVQGVQNVRNLRTYQSEVTCYSDERTEWNLLLRDWLVLCLARAEQVEPV